MKNYGRLCLITIMTIGGLAQPTTSEAAVKPNIIIILADDLGYADISCYGSERFHTPALDGMAKDGMRFTDFHSNGAVCSPTRAALLTGRYQQRSGVEGVVTAARHRHTGLGLKELTFAEVMKAAGYRTSMIGKWHIGYKPELNPVHQGFDEFVGYVSGNVDYQIHIDQTGAEDWWTRDKLAPEEGYSTDLITKHAVDFVKSNKDKPFLLYIAHESPHFPYQGRKTPPRYEPGVGRDRNKDPYDIPVYKEMIEVMDEGIGKVRQAVIDAGIEKNTFIFFFSDNGPAGPGSAAPLRGRKGQVYEGGHRVPAIACWPGSIAAGTVSDVPGMGMDLFPTMAALGGAKIPEGHILDGVSLAEYLKGGESPAARDLFWVHGKGKAMRRGEYKLVTIEKSSPELYKLKKGVGEEENLAKKEPEKVKELHEALKAWYRNMTEGVERRS